MLERDHRSRHFFLPSPPEEAPMIQFSRSMLVSAALLCFAALHLSLAQAGAQTGSQTLTITLAGQAMIRSDIRATVPAAVPVIKSMLKGDVIFTNFEAAVAEPGEITHQGRGFLTPPESLDALTAFGFNMPALSDNHAFDYKAKGVQNTLAEVIKRKIAHAGIGANLAEAAAPGYLQTTGGAIVALVASASGLIVPGANATASTPGVNELRVMAWIQQNEATADLPAGSPNTPGATDASRILDSIREARQHAALVIVYQHNHVFSNHSFSSVFTEGLAERLAPNAWLINWAHTEIEAGADIIVMHGAPLLHGIEIYHGKPIFYDLGSFIYNTPAILTYIDEPMAWETAVATVQFSGGKLQSISLQPVVLNTLGEGQPDVHDEYADNEFLHTRGLPSPATGARAQYILDRVAEFSKPFGTTIKIYGDTATIELPAK
jgi:poly-gamma-glutamate capsule biosynthesis protein CapA/YwtB (metallophosphatase superfamily)